MTYCLCWTLCWARADVNETPPWHPLLSLHDLERLKRQEMQEPVPKATCLWWLCLSPWPDVFVKQAFTWFCFTAQGALNIYFIPKSNMLSSLSSNNSEIRFSLVQSSPFIIIFILWASGRKGKENSAKIKFAQWNFLLYYLNILLSRGARTSVNANLAVLCICISST